MKEVFFIPSYVCLRDFFSIVDLKKENLIICADNDDLFKFLNEILNGYSCEIIKIRKKITGFFNINRQKLELLNEYKLIMLEYSNSNFYYFCKEWTLEIFFLISNFYKIKLYFIESEKNIFLNKIRINSIKNLFKILHIYYLSIMLGIRIKPIMSKSGLLTFRYIENKSEVLEIKKLSFIQIKEKLNYSFSLKKCLKKRILYIHENISGNDTPGIFGDETLKNIISFLKNKELEDYEVYIKGHPKHSIEMEYSCFKTIRREIPVEFIDESTFDLFFTISSLGIEKFLHTERAYTLYNYVKFKDKGYAKNIKSYIEMNLKNIIFYE